MQFLALFLVALAFLQGANAQISNYNTVIEVHGILGAVAWVIFFPLGAVAIRLLNTPKAWLVHAIIQLFAYAMFITNAGLGIWMGVTTQQLNNYHARIGLVLFSVTFFQPIGGFLHHYLFTKQKRSTIIAQTHIWLGRALITLGMINGGLGMRFGGDPTRSEDIAYGVVAGLIWVSWILVVVFVGVKSRRENVLERDNVREREKERRQDNFGESGQI